MEEILKYLADHVALAVETTAVLLAAFGAGQALFRTLAGLAMRTPQGQSFKHIWTAFGRWLLLALQFTLAADIVRSAIAPSWEQIGQLAAIAAIRTFLSYFLERDLEELNRSKTE